MVQQINISRMGVGRKRAGTAETTRHKCQSMVARKPMPTDCQPWKHFLSHWWHKQLSNARIVFPGFRKNLYRTRHLYSTKRRHHHGKPWCSQSWFAHSAITGDNRRKMLDRHEQRYPAGSDIRVAYHSMGRFCGNQKLSRRQLRYRREPGQNHQVPDWLTPTGFLPFQNRNRESAPYPIPAYISKRHCRDGIASRLNSIPSQ